MLLTTHTAKPLSVQGTQELVDECLRTWALAITGRTPEKTQKAPAAVPIFKPVQDHLTACLGTFEGASSSFYPDDRQSDISEAAQAVQDLHISSDISDSPDIDWDSLSQWYSVVVHPADRWLMILEEACRLPDSGTLTEDEAQSAYENVLQSQNQLRETLIKVTTSILKKPGGRLSHWRELRAFLVILENPLLHVEDRQLNDSARARLSGPLAGQHSGLIKRIVGLIHNLPKHLHRQLIHWWKEHDIHCFTRTKDLVSGFLGYRLLRQEATRRGLESEALPELASELQFNPSTMELEDGINQRTGIQSVRKGTSDTSYHDDWQIRAACHVLGLLFQANFPHAEPHGDRTEGSKLSAARNGRFLPMSDFYSSLADYSQVHSEFYRWGEGKSFSLSQYPFLLSIWAKTQMLKRDVDRLMEHAAVGHILSGTNRFLTLSVRRDCLADDSLTEIGTAVGSGTGGLSRALRIKFDGEEGIDGGGPRKEWFNLVIGEVFDPRTGIFLYDEYSQYCYFNPQYTSDDDLNLYFNIGATMGLAIANSTVLDIPLPPFVFRRLIADAPGPSTANIFTGISGPYEYSLDDLAEYHPQLAAGLAQLLHYEGDDVERVFSLDFAIDVERYDGTSFRISLCPDGDKRPVTSLNRGEYVGRYIRYLLYDSVRQQVDAFLDGFYRAAPERTSALFRADELDLLLRGSDEPLDIGSLRSMAEYEGWGSPNPDRENEPLVAWFWEVFDEASPVDQRRLLSFVTGSDRLPSVGAAVAPLRISCLGDETDRYPVARTCFNLLSLHRYETKEELAKMLWRAVYDSEGFGLA